MPDVIKVSGTLRGWGGGTNGDKVNRYNYVRIEDAEGKLIELGELQVVQNIVNDFQPGTTGTFYILTQASKRRVRDGSWKNQKVTLVGIDTAEAKVHSYPQLHMNAFLANIVVIGGPGNYVVALVILWLVAYGVSYAVSSPIIDSIYDYPRDRASAYDFLFIATIPISIYLMHLIFGRSYTKGMALVKETLLADGFTI